MEAKEEYYTVSGAIGKQITGLSLFIIFPTTGPGVKDASCGPSPETDRCPCAQTSLDCPLGPTAAIPTQ